MPGDVPGKLPGNQKGDGAIQSVNDLTLKWEVLDQRWKLYLASLTDESLDEFVYKISNSSKLGKRIGTRRGDVLLHVCTHAQYTTAQFMNLLRHLGVTSLPEVMLISSG